MKVRCKFACISVTKSTGGVNSVSLQPVGGKPGDTTHENSKFWKWTPSGKLEFSSINAEAMAQFEPGKEYYVDITAAE